MIAQPRTLYSCTHMATVGVKGLKVLEQGDGDRGTGSVLNCQVQWIRSPALRGLGVRSTALYRALHRTTANHLQELTRFFYLLA